MESPGTFGQKAKDLSGVDLGALAEGRCRGGVTRATATARADWLRGSPGETPHEEPPHARQRAAHAVLRAPGSCPPTSASAHGWSSVPPLSFTCRRARCFGTRRVCVEDFYTGTSGQTPTRVWQEPSTGVRVRRRGFKLQTRHQQLLFPLFGRDNGTCHGMGAPKEQTRQGCKRLGEPLALTRNGGLAILTANITVISWENVSPRDRKKTPNKVKFVQHSSVTDRVPARAGG